MRQESLDFLRRIADAPSPSGYEQPAARVYTEPFAVDGRPDLGLIVYTPADAGLAERIRALVAGAPASV